MTSVLSASILSSSFLPVNAHIQTATIIAKTADPTGTVLNASKTSSCLTIAASKTVLKATSKLRKAECKYVKDVMLLHLSVPLVVSITV